MKLKENCFVKHNSYGNGRVISIKERKALVEFQEGDIKSVFNRAIKFLSKENYNREILVLRKANELKYVRRNEIGELLNAGKSYVQVARKFNISKQRVKQIAGTLGIDIMRERWSNRKALLKKIKSDLSLNLTPTEIKVKYNLTPKELEPLYRLGFSFRNTFNQKRNKVIGNRYQKGTIARKLTKDEPDHIKSVRGIYGVVSKKLGIYKYPEIKRGCSGFFENKKTINYIKKSRLKGMKFREIAEDLNTKGISTITGLKFDTASVIAKYNKTLKLGL